MIRNPFRTNMRISSLLSIVIGSVFYSCVSDPEFASTPEIGLENYTFFEGLNTNPDTLTVVINFEDNEGDLGLGTDEQAAPYNLQNYFNNKTGQVVQGSIFLEDLMTLGDRQNIDSLPPYEEPFSCTRWTTSPNLFVNDTSRLQDTVYFQFNPRHYNFFVEFNILENGEFRKFDFRNELDCGTTFDGRFPRINVDTSSPKEGTITYKMQSRFLLAFFENETLKLRMRIVDRAGNYSNWITTGEFTLREIQIN